MDDRPMTSQQAEYSNRFTYHPPQQKLGQIERYQKIRDFAKDFSFLLDKECPYSRELSLAITKLEECVMWANAAIARNEK
jgi:hypothetical protein